MNIETKHRIVEPFLNQFETEEMRFYCQDMVEQIPDYIFEMPSSTTGKWHNKTQCLPHGQIYHAVMFAVIVNYRLNLKYNKEKKFPDPKIRDAIRCTPWFHDALKCGDGTSQWTVHEHPLLAAEWVRTAKVEHNIDDELKEFIANLCAAHSGEWTTARRGSKTILPEPQTEAEIFVHECDYLSSRNDIDMNIPEYLSELFSENDAEKKKTFDVNNYTLSFGKHKGNKLIDIYKRHPDYVEWLEENVTRPDVLDAIKAIKSIPDEVDVEEDEL